MPAYVIANVQVHGQEGYERYRDAVPATIAAYGGRYLARGGAAESLEGSWQPGRLVILEFPSANAARAWYGSDEYRSIVGDRLANASTELMLVEGLDA